MRAIIITKSGGPEVLEIAERPIPEITDGQVLIEVRAAGVNRPDIFQRKGNYPPPDGVAADIPGLEVAGIVVDIGLGVPSVHVGDRVMALVAGGGYADFVAVDAGSCIRLPENVTFEEAACLPENLFTVWHNVFQRGCLTTGERFVVHGGAGGIGYTAIQLAKAFGAEVFTTVSTAEKEGFARRCGADHVVRYREEDFAERWKDVKIDVVLDSIGGEYFDKNIQVLRSDGRLVYINATGGAHVHLNLFKLMQSRIYLTGSTLRARDSAFKAALAREIEEKVLPLVRDGRFKVEIDRTFPLADAAAAHEHMEENKHMGKLVLVM